MPNTPEHPVTFWSTYKHQVSRPTAFEKTCKTFDAMKHPERPIASSMIGGVAGGIVGTLLFFTKPITSLAVASKDYATRQSIDDESIKAAKTLFSKDYEQLNDSELIALNTCINMLRLACKNPKSHASQSIINLIQAIQPEDKEEVIQQIHKQLFNQFKTFFNDSKDQHMGKNLYKITADCIRSSLEANNTRPRHSHA